MSTSADRTPLLSPGSQQSATSQAIINRNRKMFWALGCIYGATAVGFGAFGAHGLKKVVSDPAKIASFATAAHYQLVHSVALLVASQAAPHNTVAGGLFTAGMTMFSGSIYALVVDPARFRFLGPVTPLGGLCLIGGWVALGLS
ncbi:DUF423-domain-containing protein [Microdochium trichocladiopsis]|uniref:DUF423-domain-containing protein n=1 Tax=Microdochium trichocladiopsis TaxID=1682393 RepID=A0A9P8Y4T8_9PEZI|nr:DUF423-domain-containing protein [Microdochium trichocladiopsis]KAH7027635.1 DUF423-domain-containing protein [Microdochium trichocladiopsis]